MIMFFIVVIFVMIVNWLYYNIDDICILYNNINFFNLI